MFMYSVRVSFVYGDGDAHDYASFQYIREPRRVELNALPSSNDVWYSAMSKLRKQSSKTLFHTNARKKMW